MARRALLFLAALCWASAAQAIPVVPGAAGYGMDTRAAYGCGTNPTVYRVTSLADSGAGTLRAAMEASGPRVVIFERSGYIDLSSDLNVTNPCLTVAGQTAPSPGITVRMVPGSAEALIQVFTHDVLFQHFAVRPGSSTCNSGFQAYGRAQYNIVFDHMSVSWQQDEGIAISQTNANGGNANVTLWRTLIAEGLFEAPGSGSCTGGGFSEGHGFAIAAPRVAMLQSVLGSTGQRNPQLISHDQITSMAAVNNIIYNTPSINAFSFGSVGNPWLATVVGNRFIAGPDSGSPVLFYYYNDAGIPEDPNDKLYSSDNTTVGSWTTAVGNMTYNPMVGSAPAGVEIPTGYTPIASSGLEAFLLPKVGARPTDRDAVDTRIIANITARTGTAYVTQPSDVGGYPSLAVNTRALTLPSNPDANSGNGYTNLEIWLQGYALMVEGPPPPTGPPDVAPAAGTVIVSAAFTGTTGLALTSYTSDIGGGWALQAGAAAGLALSNAGRVRNATIGDSTVTLAAGIPISTQYDIDVDFRVVSLTPGGHYVAWARALPGSTTGYYFGYTVDTGQWDLGQAINGAFTSLTFCSLPLTVSTTPHVTFRMRDASKHGVINGTQCASTTNNSLSTTGQAGISAYMDSTGDDDTHGIHFDNFVVTDVDVVTGVSRLRLRFR